MTDSFMCLGGSPELKASELPTTVLRAIELSLERNAHDGLILDLRGLSDVTDFFLIVSGDSDVHVKAIYDHIVSDLACLEIRPAGVEGQSVGRWVLIDFIEFIVHVFHPVPREFYQLERLWGDAPRLALEEVG